MNGADYVWAIVELLVILALIGAVIYALIRLTQASRNRASGPVEVVARVPLEPRRTVYLLKIGERGVLIGSSDAGLQTLAELGPDDIAGLEFEAEPAPKSFAEHLSARLGGSSSAGLDEEASS